MQTITIPGDSAARASFTMDGDYMAPYIRSGEIVAVEWALPAEGDCGIFDVDGAILLRQYCEDSFGNIYLFVLDRSRKEMDRTIPAGQSIRCLGRVIMPKRPPLPLD